MCKAVRGWRWGLVLAGWLVAQGVGAQTVVAWNLEWFPGMRPNQEDAAVVTQHMAAAQAELRRLNPDILVASELRDHEVFDRLVSVVTGLHVAVVTAFRDDDGSIDRQQIGIASRYPIYTAWAESWSPTMARLPRGFAVAAVREPVSGKLIVVYGVHLKSNRAQSERDTALNLAMRNESAHQLVDDFHELRRLVVKDDDVLGWMVAGDFNTNHDGQFGDDTIRILQRAGFHNTWAGVPPEQRQTWRGEEPFKPTTFDYIMTYGLGSLTAELADAPMETSDHLPVVLRLDAKRP